MTAVDWSDCVSVADLHLTFSELCGLHPALAAHYHPDEEGDDATLAARAAEREAAVVLFVEASDADVELRVGVLSEWGRMGLLDAAATLPWQVLPQQSVAVRVAAEARVPEARAAYEATVTRRRRAARVQMEQRMATEAKQEEEKEKRASDARKRGGLVTDGSSEVFRGEVVHVDAERGLGEISIKERACVTSFNLQWAEYGLKEIRLADVVTCQVVSRKFGRVREEAVDVRPAVPRNMDDLDVVKFVRDCRGTQPAKVLSRIITAHSDFCYFCNILKRQPPRIGTALNGCSWFDAVMSIIELTTLPLLQEPRYRSIITRFLQQVTLTPFPHLLTEVAKIVSDEGNLEKSCHVAEFTECLRVYCFRNGAETDLSDDFFENIVALLERVMLGATEAQRRVRINIRYLEQIRQHCARIRQNVDERSLFPSKECFGTSPDSPDHPYHTVNLPKTQHMPWSSIEEYVGCHFSLMKADCFRRVVCSMMYRLGAVGYDVPQDRQKDMEFATKMYSGVEVIGEAFGDRGVWLCLRFDVPDDYNPFKSLEKGTLLCIAIAREDDVPMMWWATVPFADAGLASTGVVAVQIIHGDHRVLVAKLQAHKAHNLSHMCLIFETKLFFAGIRPVLEALDYLRRQPNIPFKNTLLSGRNTEENRALPGYVPECYRDAFFDIVSRMLARYTYEPGQHRSLRWLPYRPVLLVQGPPGTGKSFIGCRLVECIAEFRIKMQSGELRNHYKAPEDSTAEKTEDIKPGPILVLTYKNHSLDEFLIDCLDSGVWCGSLRDETRCACKSTGPSKYCCKVCCDKQGHPKKLVRVGARSQSSRLSKYNLDAVRKPRYGHRHKQRSIANEAARVSQQIRDVDAGSISEDVVRNLLTSHQMDVLTHEGTVPLEQAWVTWLSGCGRVFDASEDAVALEEAGRNVKELGFDPDNVEYLFHQQKEAYNELHKKHVEEAQRQAAQDGDAPPSAFQFQGKGYDEIDVDFISSLRARRSFFRTFSPVPPAPPCEVEPSDFDERLATEIQSKVRTEEVPEVSVPKVMRHGPLKKPAFAEAEALWDLEDDQRKLLAGYWLANFRRTLQQRFDDLKVEYEGMEVIDNQELDEARFEALQNADIIGLTSTGAAKHQAVLRSVKPSVLMVEEAAEILEGQILGCFVDSIRQIILIGDHRQLKPSVDDKDYAEKNELNVSMFQRLIETCKVPYSDLTEQRRMCSSVADLVRPIYPKLTDFTTLAHRKMDWGDTAVPSIPGLCNPVKFWSHRHKEEASDVGLSVMNRREVEMVSFLVQALVCKQGLQESQITVLSPYLGQTRCLKQAMATMGKNNVECLTVDRFQGDENDIIIISLVRTEKLTSFIRLENRMCVACSRARFGFIMVGNDQMLNRVEHWKRTLEIIAAQHPEALSDCISLRKPGTTDRWIAASSSQPSFPDPRKDESWSSAEPDVAALRAKYAPPEEVTEEKEKPQE